MADRVVKVTLRAQVEEYKRGMAEAAKGTRELGSEAAKLAQKRDAFNAIGRASLAMGVSIGAGLTIAVGKFAEFDQAMSFVAGTGQDARDAIDGLREAALEAGSATVFSATESANAIEELAKAGVSAQDIMGGGLAGALDLAAAGGLGVADAAGIAGTALGIFGLKGSEMSHVADLLAAGAGKAMGDVSDLSQALAQGGQVAAATGLSIEETTAALAAFASQGLLGSDAGTSLKTMLQRLTPQSAEAAKKFRELGISAYDANGQFVGLANFAGQLETAMGDLTPQARNAAMAVMFGSDAVRAANVLFKEGSTGIQQWITDVDDAGYAAETAATRLDNLAGDWEALGGAVDTAMITMGSAADGPLRGLVQTVTDLVDEFNELPGGVQQAVFWVGAAGSAALIAGGLYLLAVPKIAEFKVALETLGPTAQGAAGKIGAFTKVAGGALAGLAVGTVVLNALQDAMDNIGPSADEMANRVATAREGIDLMQAGISKSDIFGRWADDAGLAAHQIANLGDVLTRFSEGGRGTIADASALRSVQIIGQQLGDMASTDLPRAQAQFRLLAESAKLNEVQQAALLDQMGPYKAELTRQATALGVAADNTSLLGLAQGEGADGAEDHAAALDDLRGAASDAEGTIESLSDAIRGFGSATLDTRDAQRQFEAAIDDAEAALAEHGATLDITTDAGRRNQRALDDIASSANDAAAAILATSGSEDEATAALARGRDALIQKGVAFGMSEADAAQYADSVIADMGAVKGAVEAIPNGKDIKVTADTGNAFAKVNELVSWISGKEAVLSVRPEMGEVGWGVLKPNFAGGLYEQGVQQFYAGGFPSGVYPGRQGGIHKFAESEMGVPWETYISGRAADRARNVGIWQETGRRLGVDTAAPQAVSIEGARITGRLEIGGDGLARIIDGRISVSEAAREDRDRRGYRGGF